MKTRELLEFFVFSWAYLACLVPFGPTSMRVFCYNRKVLLKISKNEVTDLRVVAGEFGGVFVYVGLDPVSDYLTGLDITDQDGWVITDDKMATRIPGIFAIGDVRQKDLRQITTAVGDGATAGIEAYNYVTALGDK